MYKAFYSLRDRPFSKTPDPRFLYFSKSHREAFARLLHAVEERDLILLTGGIGCGKTTLSRALIDELSDRHRIVLLTNPRLSPLEFLFFLATRLGVDTPSMNKAQLLEQLSDQLYGFLRQDILPVLIIDEAQLIPHKDLFDEIRLLTNFQLDEVNLISIVLMGQPELLKRLAHQAYEPLRLRIGIHFALEPLQIEEVGAYLKHRLANVGGRSDLFMEEAIFEIALHSGGIPRRINQLASLALLEGFGRGLNQIDATVITEVASELEGL